MSPPGVCVGMINYTERIALLMKDVVARTPRLSFIDLNQVIVFARFGRSDAEGAFATCHCLTLPESEPGYFFWKDRETGQLTRRSPWFVTKSPQVKLGTTTINYLISFVLPRFSDQTMAGSRKADLYRETRSMDREARHDRPRAVSHRPDRDRYPRHRECGRQPLLQVARSTVLRERRRDGAGLSRDQAGSGALRVPEV